ncbi:MAG TPA: GspE/PulE family protein [Candidatus Saccharimonadales bacterium]|nr:GspE/PulE family protein [Candidatus Saccharimonadales bacterium]
MPILSPDAQTHVEQTLVSDGLITALELADYKKKAAATNQPVFSLMMQEGKFTDEQLTKALASAANLPYVNLTSAQVNKEVLGLLPFDLAEHYMAVPLGEMQERLVVAMLDAGNVQAVDFLSNKIGRPLKVYAASEAGIKHVLSQYSSKGLQQGVASILSEGATTETEQDNDMVPVGTADKKVQTIVEDSPVSKALSAILDYAATNRASDVHIEPLEKEIKIRCRVDGVLVEIMKLPKSVEAPLISRIKILSNLKIDEHRIPQDGQFTIRLKDQTIDMRVAVSPVIWGEQVVLRLLDKSGTKIELESMGYTGRALNTIRKGLKLPHGMILTSGPTGSGKSTSMYAMIQEIKSDSINIVTLEDPVEYKIEGVNQIQINPDVGLTFANGLRSVLRQDPDVVMVGEIRDKETANLAVQAALTGHLVFSTLHTNSAAGILPRLLEMEIEPFLIASTVHTVIGQRLVRRTVSGGQMYQSTAAETKAIQSVLGGLLPKTKAEMPAVAASLGYQTLPLAGQNAYTLVKGKESPDNPTGYKGRLGLYEVFEVTEAIQDLILKHAPSSAIQKAAIEQGMVTMRQDGYLKSLAGMTTLLEVDRVASGDS